MRILTALALVLMPLVGCNKETSASDLLTAIVVATDGKCNIQYMTHQCRIAMASTRNPDVIAVMVTAQRTWVNPNERGSAGDDVTGTIVFNWNPSTGELVKAE